MQSRLAISLVHIVPSVKVELIAYGRRSGNKYKASRKYLTRTVPHDICVLRYLLTNRAAFALHFPFQIYQTLSSYFQFFNIPSFFYFFSLFNGIFYKKARILSSKIVSNYVQFSYFYFYLNVKRYQINLWK